MISCSTSSNNCLITTQILAHTLANFLWSISGQTHEFIIYLMQQRVRADNLTVYCKKQMNVCFSWVCPGIDNDFRHNIVKVVYGSTWLLPLGSTATLAMLC